MARTIFDPILVGIEADRRQEMQELFGRHVVEQRNRMAVLVRRWIEGDDRFPVPIYDRVIERVRQLDPSMRQDVASICLLMADQVVSAVLSAFDAGAEMKVDEKVVNYAVIAQVRDARSGEVIEEVDVNRGEPVIAIWDRYKKWLARFAPSELRCASSRAGSSAHE